MLNTSFSLLALIIDDDPNMRSILGAVLRDGGWSVIEAANGMLGVEAYAEHRPDLVLVDVMMPVMDGLEVCARIRPDADQRRVPLIVITALDDPEAINQAFDAGATDFVNKPLNIRLIRRRFQSLRHATEVEHAIRRAKLEWEATFDVVSAGIIVTDEETRIIRCNQAIIRRFGTSYAALLRRPIGELFFGDAPLPPDAARTFEVDEIETQFPLLRGWFHVTNHPVPLDGHSASYVHVLRDITAMRQAQQDLRESEERFRATVENLAEGIVLLDRQGIIKYVSPTGSTILGYPAHELLGMNIFGLVHPAGRANAQARLQAVAQNFGGHYVYPTQVQQKSGETRWLEVTSRNALDEPGVNALVVNFHDITDRRAAEKSLALQAAVLENMAEGVVIIDTDDRIQYTNHALDAMFGYPAGELLGQGTGVLDHIPTAEATVAALMAQLDALGHWTGEIENQRKDGTPIITESRVSQIEVQGAHFRVGVKTDITERKQTQAWILNTQKLADLGTLAAGVAHELNSPLQVITGLSESLQHQVELKTLAPERLARNLDVIHRNGWRCAEIVRSLHTYARASGGQLVPANLNDLVRDSLLLMEHQLKSWSNITIRTELAADLPELCCDRNQITQVLINLLTNARDAMELGGEIAIQTCFAPREQEIHLQVADNGAGIPDVIRTKIFDPFFTTKPIGKGTGLGLSIVAGIIRAYGGEIGVDSQVGQGTTFTLRFPVQSLPAGVPAAVANSAGRFYDAGQALLAPELSSEN